VAKKRPVKQVDRLQDYHTLFNTALGKRVLNDMMSTHYVMNSTFHENPGITALREGERNVVLRILTILKLDLNQIRERIEHDEKIRDNETII